ncbi:TonB-dependent receptor [Paraflavisolibacter sp. H34]|uniref:TonB-dependent receptor n=1 Tax=Huijunlia imazamoxiresistens TaxID=3127457 RepID=UPI0030158FC5
MRAIFPFILLFLLSPGAFSQTCGLRLSGHVEDADTKEKLSRAVVTIRETGAQLTTDEKGDFLFPALCAGVYTLQVHHPHCDTAEKRILFAKDHHIDIFLPHARRLLGAVVVEVQKGTPNTGFKKELRGRELEQTRGHSLAEALSRVNGVTLLQTGSTISKPVIHGLHGSRILTINNGVRQEGQQWGNEHAPEIDPFIADRLTVIKGVDELRYGSDAIGGVILVEPKALRTTPGASGELHTGGFTNNRQFVVSGVWEQRLRKAPAFGYRLQGTFKKGANVTTPGYRLNNTGSEEKNFSATAGWKKDRFSTELFYSQFATRLGIFAGAHIGNLTDLKTALAASRPDAVFLGQNTYRIGRPYQEVAHHLLKSRTLLRKGEHQFNLLLAGQWNNRKEYDIVRSSSNTRPQLDLSIATMSGDLSWEPPKFHGLNGTTGVSAAVQDNTYSGRYFIPNYRSYSWGGYLVEKWSRHRWELQAGARFDHKTIRTNRLKFNGDTLNHDFNFSTLAASLNGIYHPSPHWQVNLNVSLASRAPYVNELLSDGIHHGTATYEKGDIGLKPERSLHLSSGVNFQNTPKTFRGELLLYANAIRDFIYQQPLPDSPVLTIAGAFPLLAYRQTSALLSGADLSAAWKIDPRLSCGSRLSVLYARNTTARDWLILMPANRISNELTYNLKERKAFSGSYLSLEAVNVMRQTRTPDESKGAQDYKAPPPGYTLVHLHAATTLALGHRKITFNLEVRNLLNTRYREYLNSMRYFTDEAGRNIGLRIKVPLHHTPGS